MSNMIEPMTAAKGRRKGITIDPEWIALEFDARLWTYANGGQAIGLDTFTIHRLFHRHSVSRVTVKKLLTALAKHPPIREVEEALPTAQREILARFRSPNGSHPRYLK